MNYTTLAPNMPANENPKVDTHSWELNLGLYDYKADALPHDQRHYSKSPALFPFHPAPTQARIIWTFFPEFYQLNLYQTKLELALNTPASTLTKTNILYTDGYTDGRTHRRTDTQTDRQADSSIPLKTFVLWEFKNFVHNQLQAFADDRFR